jgi:predicted transcriptional regulator with HTH domain
MENGKTNRKEYTEVKEISRVVTSREEAVDGVIEIMEASHFTDEHLVKCVLGYIDKVIKPEFKADATIKVIEGIGEALPKHTISIERKE